jgi:peptidoglycan/LPS O-acetylase OafA/YrhL
MHFVSNAIQDMTALSMRSRASLVVVGLSIAQVGHLSIPPAVRDFVWLYLPSFLFGSIAGIWAAKDDKAGVPAYVPVLALAALWLTIPDGYLRFWKLFSDRPFPFESDLFGVSLHPLQGLLWAAVLLGGLRPFWRRLFEFRILRFYGRISYGLYMTHIMVKRHRTSIFSNVVAQSVDWLLSAAADSYFLGSGQMHRNTSRP